MLKQKKKFKTLLSNREDLLTEFQKTKCFEKFESYKALGSMMLSKNQLRRVLIELGKEISEEELLDMIYEADPNGHGYISYEAFQKIVTAFKQFKEENISHPIALTFDQILRCYQASNPSRLTYTIPWSYIQFYLQQNFGLKVNLKNFKSFNSKSELTREDFKFIFS